MDLIKNIYYKKFERNIIIYDYNQEELLQSIKKKV